MLRQLLTLLAQNEVIQVKDLAQRLQTTPAMIRVMLDTLERQGHLRKVTPTCGSDTPCETCPLHGLCGLRGAPPPLWERRQA